MSEKVGLEIMEVNDEQFRDHLLEKGGGIDPIHHEWPVGTRVKGIVNGKERFGVVVEKPLEEIRCFAPRDVPVKWDCNETMVSAIATKKLQKV